MGAYYCYYFYFGCVLFILLSDLSGGSPLIINHLKSCFLEEYTEGLTLDSVAVEICVQNLIQLLIFFFCYTDCLLVI